MSTIRTFVAVDITPAIADRACDLMARLQLADAGVKWVAPENLHLTLKFLGDVPDTDTPSVCRQVAQAVVGFGAFEMVLRGAGAFPNARRPRTLWIGVEQGAEPLRQLHKIIDRELSRRGFPKEHKPFQPHLTIGRIRRPGPQLAELSKLLEKHVEFDAGRCRITEVVCYASFLDKQGPTYKALGRSSLGD